MTTEERLTSLEGSMMRVEKLISDSIADNRQTRISISEAFEKVDENFIIIDKHLKILHQKIGDIDVKIDEVDKKIDGFSGKTDESIKDVNLHLVSIKEEISKINKVTGYEAEHNNLKLVNGK